MNGAAAEETVTKGAATKGAVTKGAAASEAASAPKPRQARAQLRHEALLAAAARIFIARGIAATSIDEIVAAAQVAKGTFYLHFDSKEQLLAALQRRFVDRFRDDLEGAMERRRRDDHRGRLRAWIATCVAVYVDRAAEHDLVFHQFRSERPHAPHDNPLVAQLADLLAAGARAQAWLTKTPRLTAVMLFAALHGALDEAVTPPPQPSATQRAPASKTSRAATRVTLQPPRAATARARSSAGSRASRPGAHIDREQLTRNVQTFCYRALGLG